MNKYFPAHACFASKKKQNFVAVMCLLFVQVVFIPSVSALPFPLPSGYFIPAKRPMQQIYPRPDIETNTWARHRWAYYDGINAIEYRIPIGVSFGAYPYKFICLACPSGMTVGSYYGDSNYGVVTWTPNGPATNAAVTVRVIDQQLNTLDITWTVSTSSSTSHFIFTDNINGNDSIGAGTITAPFKTPAKSLSPTYATTINYFRTGTYVINNSIGAAASPMALLNYPGEAVTFDMSTGSLGGTGSVSDVFLQGITFSGGVSTVASQRTIWLGGSYDRQTFHALSFINPINGGAVTDNASSIFFESNSSYRRYIYIADSSEIGRPVGVGQNSAGLFVAFTVSDSLFERNAVTHSNAGMGNLFLKASVYNSSLRNNYVQTDSIEQMGLGSADQVDSSLPAGNNEISYNVVKSPTAPSDYDNTAALTVNFYSGSSSPSNYWVYRNTIYGGLCVRQSTSANGPFIFENNAVIVNTLNSTPPSGFTGVWAYKSWTGWPNASITDSGTECEGAVSSAYVNTGTMQLAGTCASNWLGRRGAQISSPNVADLSLSATALQTSSSTSLFHVTVNNAGPSDASSLTVNTVLPSGVTLVTGSSSGNCAQSGQVVACTATTLTNGASIVFNIAVSSSSSQPINLSFNASSNTADNIGSNNNAAVAAMLPTFADLLKVQQYLLNGNVLPARDIQRLDVFPENQGDNEITFSDFLLLQKILLTN
jgi:uncharacterized repeat protein (TIGR01451 family)